MMKLDPDKMWVTVTGLVVVCAAVVSVTAYVVNDMNGDSTMTRLIAEQSVAMQKDREAMIATAAQESRNRERDIQAINDTMNRGFEKMAAQLERIVMDAVSTRRAETWIIQFRELNPTLKVPDLPK